MLTCEIINNPSQNTVRILKRKVYDKKIGDLLESQRIEAVGLIQGQMAKIITAANVVEKAADVLVLEIVGSCPQHITMIASLEVPLLLRWQLTQFWFEDNNFAKNTNVSLYLLLEEMQRRISGL